MRRRRAASLPRAGPRLRIANAKRLRCLLLTALRSEPRAAANRPNARGKSCAQRDRPTPLGIGRLHCEFTVWIRLKEPYLLFFALYDTSCQANLSVLLRMSSFLEPLIHSTVADFRCIPCILHHFPCGKSTDYFSLSHKLRYWGFGDSLEKLFSYSSLTVFCSVSDDVRLKIFRYPRSLPFTVSFGLPCFLILISRSFSHKRMGFRGISFISFLRKFHFLIPPMRAFFPFSSFFCSMGSPFLPLAASSS